MLELKQKKHKLISGIMDEKTLTTGGIEAIMRLLQDDN